ncbi:MAG: B12-binding domain-containing radical SAM protein, partial [Bacteroidales bacterium]|nr:B12-binding domain-containing radical SAM protein [Bacteroidales bacterium]
MLRVGFLFPSSDYLHDPFRGDPHTHFQVLTVLEDRLAERVDVRLIDLRGIDRRYAKYHIPECDVYLQSAYTLDWEEQLDVVHILRDYYPQAIHIAGGPHVTEFPEESLKTFDALVLGDGEEMIVRALEDIEAGQLQKVYRNEAPVDVNAYPIPRRHYLPKATIARKDMLTLKRDPKFRDIVGTTVIFSRGCPFKCAFCAMPKMRMGQGIRYRRPDLVTAEIEYLKRDYGIQGISLLDEIGIPLKRDHAVLHLEAIGAANIHWRGQCRVDGITPEIAELAHQSGCVAMGLGVESAWQPSLDAINKKIKVERARETIKLLKANNIEVRLYMIFGLPGEPPDIQEKTWQFIQETDPDLVYLSLFTIRPGTAVFREPAKFGIKEIKTNWSNTRHMHGRYD